MASTDNKWQYAFRSLVERNDKLVKQLLKEKTKCKHLQELLDKQNRLKYRIVNNVDAATQTDDIEIPSVGTPKRSSSNSSKKVTRKSLGETYANPIHSGELTFSMRTPRSIPKRKLYSGSAQYLESPVNVKLQLPRDTYTPDTEAPATPPPPPSLTSHVTPPARYTKNEDVPSTKELRYARRNRKEISYKETPLNVKVRKGFQFFKLKTQTEDED